jgi:putative lipoic acid-binding regulatory protein
VLKSLLEFPLDYTFKIIGEDIPPFRSAVEEAFESYGERALIETKRKGKYISYSVTLFLKEYDEMERLYTAVSKAPGLRFYI